MNEKEKTKIQMEFEIRKLVANKFIWLVLAILLAVIAADWSGELSESQARILYAIVAGGYVVSFYIVAVWLRKTKGKIDEI